MVLKTLRGILIAVILMLIFTPVVFSEGEVIQSEGDEIGEVIQSRGDEIGEVIQSEGDEIGEVKQPEGKKRKFKGKKKTKFSVLNDRILHLEEKLLKMEEEEKVRKRLESAEEAAESDEEDTEDDVLAAAGRDYTLMKPGIIGLGYNFDYTASTYDSLVDSSRIEHNANHSISNSISVQYPIADNLTYTANISYLAKMNTQSNSSKKDVTDLGDSQFGIQWQPTKSVGGGPSKIVNFSVRCPTGRSQYKIDPWQELATGSGGYSLNLGYNVSMPIDPVFVYGGLSYNYPFPISGLRYHQNKSDGEAGVYLKKVIPGNSFGFNMGFGYSLSYSLSISFGYSYNYSTKTSYEWIGRPNNESADGISSSISMGTNWSVTPKRKVSIKLNIGLTNDAPDFTLSFSVPFKIET